MLGLKDVRASMMSLSEEARSGVRVMVVLAGAALVVSVVALLVAIRHD